MDKSIDFDRVAEFYDLYVRATHDLAFWTRAVAASAPPRLELMCGTGRITVRVLEAGHALEGLDCSAGLLRVLRRKLRDRGLSTALHHADARDFSLPGPYGLVFIGFNSLSEVRGDADKSKLFGTVRRHLAGTGSFWVTLRNPGAARSMYDGRRVDLGRHAVPGTGETVEVSGTYRLDEAAGEVRGEQRYRCVRDGAVTRELALPLRFNLVEPERLDRLLSTSGFRVRARLGDYDGSVFDPKTSPYLIAESVPS